MKDENTILCNGCLCTNVQILMSVLRVHTTVIKSVPTLKALTTVPVTVDTY